MTIRSIAIVMAMREEARPIIDSLGLKRTVGGLDGRLPFESYQASINGLSLHLALGGTDAAHGVDNVATQPATLLAYLTLDRFQPDLLINAGTAGGLRSRGAAIGDVYISTGVLKYHDRRIPIPGFAEYGVGGYPAARVDRLAGDLGLRPGVVSTGNSLDMTEGDLEMIRANGAYVKDMEAAAIGWVAMVCQTPFFALKSITDLIDTDRPAQEEFLANMDTASRQLSRAVISVVDYCLNKDLKDLAG